MGSIGRRHLTNVQKLLPDAYCIVWHLRHPAKETIKERGISHCYTLGEALCSKPDVAIICSPASYHVKTATDLVNQGIPVFIEKPLSNSIEGIPALLEACREKSVTATVGYNLRFSLAVQRLGELIDKGRIGKVHHIYAEVGQYLPDWRPAMDYRLSISARETLGGGAVLELSHEIDLLLWLVGEEVAEVFAQLGKLSDLDIDVEDSADILLKFKNGVQGSIHMDMLQRSPRRLIRVVGSEGTLLLDLIAGQIELLRAGDPGSEQFAPGQDGAHSSTYVDELKHFFECVSESKLSDIPLETGERVLRVALAAKQAAKEGRTIKL